MAPRPPTAASPAPSPEVLRLPAWQVIGRSVAPTALADMDGRITYANSAFLGLWGFSFADQVLGQAADGPFWDDPVAAAAALSQPKERRLWQGELVARRADGTTLPVRCTAHVMHDDQGRPIALMGSFVNLHEEAMAKQDLQAERRFSDAVLSAAGVLVLVLDQEGHIVRFNAECEKVSGWRAEEVLGQCPWETVLPRDVAGDIREEAFVRPMRQALPGQKTNYTNEWQVRDGSRRLIEWTNSILDTDGAGSRFMVSIGVDVTARQAAELALERSEGQLRHAQSVAGIGSWHRDLQSGRLDWSEQIYRLFEIDPDSPPDNDLLLARVHSDDRHSIVAAFQSSLSSVEPVCVEHRLQMPDGRIKWVETFCESETDADGRALRTSGTLRDVTPQRARETELQRFQHMVEHAPYEIWLTDKQMRVRYVNKAAADSLGYTKDELLQMTLAQIDTRGGPPVQKELQVTRAKLAAGEATSPVEVEHRARGGRCIPKELRSSIVQLDGETLGCAFLQDITERRRAQALLTANEAQLREVLGAYPGHVACVNDDLEYLYVNDAVARSMGRPKREIIGKTVRELLGDAVHAELQQVNARLAAGEDVQIERRYADTAGFERIYWVHYRIAKDADAPNRHRFYGFGTDITDMRRTQVRLSAVLEATGIGTWEWDLQTGRLEVSDEVPILAGYDRESLPKDPIHWIVQRIHPSDRPVRRARFARLLTGEAQSVDSEFRVWHQERRWIWIQERTRVSLDGPSGRPLRITGTVQDMSALKEHEQELQRLNAQLEQRVEERTRALAVAKVEAERASAAKSEFLSRMSHELRTPLNAIIGFAQLLEMADLPREEAEHAQEVMRGGQHLLGLINEVLDLATIESGRVPLVPEEVSLANVVDECVQLLRPTSRQADVTVETHVEESCTPTHADRRRLKQVLLNLLSNAIKYNKRGGTVSISCACGVAGTCELRVSDTGVGLRKDQLARVFESFERLSVDRDGIPGTGIGLTVSKRLVELMGGTIGVESELGRGSSFWIRLPLAQGETPGRRDMRPKSTAVAPLSATALGHGCRRVLYVEDNPSNQRLMERMLAKRGDIELTTTADPLAAIRLAVETEPSLILMDIQLPGMCGYDVLSGLRDAGVQVPVIAVSANAMPDDVNRGRDAGFADYLTKPLELGRLLEAVDASLPQS